MEENLLLVMRTLKIYSLNNFPVYPTAVLAIVSLLYIYISLVLISEKAMAPHSSTLAWEIPWMEETGGLQSMGSLRVRHD